MSASLKGKKIYSQSNLVCVQANLESLHTSLPDFELRNINEELEEEERSLVEDMKVNQCKEELNNTREAVGF